MQKIVNVIALLSGLTSLAVIGGGAYLYLNKDAMIEDVRAKATKEITKAITEALPGMIDSAIPELPTSTGNVLPESTTNVPAVTGPAIPF
jgi:hypothetical protein